MFVCLLWMAALINLLTIYSSPFQTTSTFHPIIERVTPIEALQWLTAVTVCRLLEGPEWSKMAADIAKTSSSTPDNLDKYALSEYTQHLDNSQQEQY